MSNWKTHFEENGSINKDDRSAGEIAYGGFLTQSLESAKVGGARGYGFLMGTLPKLASQYEKETLEQLGYTDTKYYEDAKARMEMFAEIKAKNDEEIRAMKGRREAGQPGILNSLSNGMIEHITDPVQLAIGGVSNHLVGAAVKNMGLGTMATLSAQFGFNAVENVVQDKVNEGDKLDGEWTFTEDGVNAIGGALISTVLFNGIPTVISRKSSAGVKTSKLDIAPNAKSVPKAEAEVKPKAYNNYQELSKDTEVAAHMKKKFSLTDDQLEEAAKKLDHRAGKLEELDKTIAKIEDEVKWTKYDKEIMLKTYAEDLEEFELSKANGTEAKVVEKRIKELEKEIKKNPTTKSVDELFELQESLDAKFNEAMDLEMELENARAVFEEAKVAKGIETQKQLDKARSDFEMKQMFREADKQNKIAEDLKKVDKFDENYLFMRKAHVAVDALEEEVSNGKKIYYIPRGTSASDNFSFDNDSIILYKTKKEFESAVIDAFDVANKIKGLDIDSSTPKGRKEIMAMYFRDVYGDATLKPGDLEREVFELGESGVEPDSLRYSFITEFDYIVPKSRKVHYYKKYDKSFKESDHYKDLVGGIEDHWNKQFEIDAPKFDEAEILKSLGAENNNVDFDETGFLSKLEPIKKEITDLKQKALEVTERRKVELAESQTRLETLAAAKKELEDLKNGIKEKPEFDNKFYKDEFKRLKEAKKQAKADKKAFETEDKVLKGIYKRLEEFKTGERSIGNFEEYKTTKELVLEDIVDNMVEASVITNRGWKASDIRNVIVEATENIARKRSEEYRKGLEGLTDFITKKGDRVDLKTVGKLFDETDRHYLYDIMTGKVKDLKNDFTKNFQALSDEVLKKTDFYGKQLGKKTYSQKNVLLSAYFDRISFFKNTLGEAQLKGAMKRQWWNGKVRIEFTPAQKKEAAENFAKRFANYFEGANYGDKFNAAKNFGSSIMENTNGRGDLRNTVLSDFTRFNEFVGSKTLTEQNLERLVLDNFAHGHEKFVNNLKKGLENAEGTYYGYGLRPEKIIDGFEDLLKAKMKDVSLDSVSNIEEALKGPRMALKKRMGNFASKDGSITEVIRAAGGIHWNFFKPLNALSQLIPELFNAIGSRYSFKADRNFATVLSTGLDTTRQLIKGMAEIDKKKLTNQDAKGMGLFYSRAKFAMEELKDAYNSSDLDEVGRAGRAYAGFEKVTDMLSLLEPLEKVVNDMSETQSYSFITTLDQVDLDKNFRIETLVNNSGLKRKDLDIIKQINSELTLGYEPADFSVKAQELLGTKDGRVLAHKVELLRGAYRSKTAAVSGNYIDDAYLTTESTKAIYMASTYLRKSTFESVRRVNDTYFAHAKRFGIGQTDWTQIAENGKLLVLLPFAYGLSQTCEMFRDMATRDKMKDNYYSPGSTSGTIGGVLKVAGMSNFLDGASAMSGLFRAGEGAIDGRLDKFAKPVTGSRLYGLGKNVIAKPIKKVLSEEE